METIAEVLPRDRRKLLAIGVGVPGLVNSDDGIAVNYKYIKNWRDVPLAQRLTKRFGVPVYLENLHRVLPKGSMLIVPLICTSRFGTPLRLEAGEDRTAFLGRARDAVLALAGGRGA